MPIDFKLRDAVLQLLANILQGCGVNREFHRLLGRFRPLSILQVGAVFSPFYSERTRAPVRTEISTMNSICDLKFFCILGLGISQSILYLTEKRGWCEDRALLPALTTE